MDYQTATETLGKRDRKKVANNTYLERRSDDTIAVRLHATDVVTYHPEFAEISTGGWFTVTTKDRINGFAPAGVRVYSEKGRWFVFADMRNQDNKTAYFDGIRIGNNGVVLNPRPSDEAEKDAREAAKTKREIAKYVKAFGAALDAGEVMPPNNGDCWYCLFKTKDGKAMGDLGEHDHLLSHMEDKYFVPSLAVNAVTEAGYVNPGIIVGYRGPDEPMRPYGRSDMVKRALTRYLKRRLVKDETV